MSVRARFHCTWASLRIPLFPRNENQSSEGKRAVLFLSRNVEGGRNEALPSAIPGVKAIFRGLPPRDLGDWTSAPFSAEENLAQRISAGRHLLGLGKTMGKGPTGGCIPLFR